MTTETMFAPKTRSGYSLDEVVSTMQKEIRRGDVKGALYWGQELFPFYSIYLWKRMLTIAIEDIADPQAIVVVESLRSAWTFSNEKRQKGEPYRDRLYITRALMYLAGETKKSRQADHAGILIEMERQVEKREVPDYGKDMHTKSGKAMGRVRKDKEYLNQWIDDQQDFVENTHPEMYAGDEYVDQLRDIIKEHPEAKIA